MMITVANAKCSKGLAADTREAQSQGCRNRILWAAAGQSAWLCRFRAASSRHCLLWTPARHQGCFRNQGAMLLALPAASMKRIKTSGFRIPVGAAFHDKVVRYPCLSARSTTPFANDTSARSTAGGGGFWRGPAQLPYLQGTMFWTRSIHLSCQIGIDNRRRTYIAITR